MAVNFLLSTAMNLTGNPIGDPSLKGFCNFNGFLTQLFVVQSRLLSCAYGSCTKISLTVHNAADYWVLVIAISTFLILGDKKGVADWVQDHSVVLWLLPWGFSALWAALGLGIAGYGDIGACE